MIVLGVVALAGLALAIMLPEEPATNTRAFIERPLGQRFNAVAVAARCRCRDERALHIKPRLLSLSESSGSGPRTPSAPDDIQTGVTARALPRATLGLLSGPRSGLSAQP